MLSDARARHAVYAEAAADRSNSYTVRLAYSKAADREARRIKRLELEEKQRRQREQSSAALDNNAAINDEMLSLMISGVLSRRRCR